MREAELDLKHGCYNKAVSASYFAVRLLVEHFIPLKTTKDDKIANALYREVEKKIGRRRAKEIREEFLKLFHKRKVADHRPYLFSEVEAQEMLERAKSLIDDLKEILSDS